MKGPPWGQDSVEQREKWGQGYEKCGAWIQNWGLNDRAGALFNLDSSSHGSWRHFQKRSLRAFMVSVLDKDKSLPILDIRNLQLDAQKYASDVDDKDHLGQCFSNFWDRFRSQEEE